MELYYATHPARANNCVDHLIQITCSLFIWVVVRHPQDPELTSDMPIWIHVNDSDIPAVIGTERTADENWRIFFLHSYYPELPRYIAFPHSTTVISNFTNVSYLYSSHWYSLE
jgi:hypothetical protein